MDEINDDFGDTNVTLVLGLNCERYCQSDSPWAGQHYRWYARAAHMEEQTGGCDETWNEQRLRCISYYLHARPELTLSGYSRCPESNYLCVRDEDAFWRCEGLLQSHSQLSQWFLMWCVKGAQIILLIGDLDLAITHRPAQTIVAWAVHAKPSLGLTDQARFSPSSFRFNPDVLLTCSASPMSATNVLHSFSRDRNKSVLTASDVDPFHFLEFVQVTRLVDAPHPATTNLPAILSVNSKCVQKNFAGSRPYLPIVLTRRRHRPPTWVRVVVHAPVAMPLLTPHAPIPRDTPFIPCVTCPDSWFRVLETTRSRRRWERTWSSRAARFQDGRHDRWRLDIPQECTEQ